MKSKSLLEQIGSAVMTLACLICHADLLAEEILVKEGQTIAFCGGSITQLGVGSPSGFVSLVMSGLEANGIKANSIPAGINGNTSSDMLARIDKDVISKKPDWITLNCGLEDVFGQDWGKGVPLDQYKLNMTTIVDLCQAAGIKVMLLTSTMIGEDQVNTKNQKLKAYNGFLRTLEKEKNCLMADINADMQAELQRLGRDLSKPGSELTINGIHMNPEGNMIIAVSILKTLGLNDKHIKKAKEQWLDIPNAIDHAAVIRLTIRDFQKLREIAAHKKVSVDTVLNERLKQTSETIAKSSP